MQRPIYQFQFASSFCCCTAQLVLCLALLLPVRANADPAALVQQWRAQNEQAIVDGFAQLLSIPNIASDTVNIRRNADYISGLFESRNFAVRLLEVSGSPPAVLAERLTPGSATTLMIYVHYDGQPVNAADWASDPWTPLLRDAPVEQGGKVIPLTAPFNPESRLFARSAGDDKAPIAALLAALDALDANGIPLAVNLKVFLEGEEEAGSPHLAEILAHHRDLLGADLWLFCDGPVHQSRRWQLSYGVRGSYGFNLTVYGPNRPLHSGHYGNWAPNPIMRLAELLTSMRDPAGNILIANYYEQIVPPNLAELEAIAAAPDVESELIKELGIVRPETADRLELAIMRPALNVRGIRSGDVGEQASNTLQTSATASIDLRLVPDQTPDFLHGVIEQHIRGQGYFIVYQDPTAQERAGHDRIARLEWENSGYPAYRAAMNLPIAQRVAAIVNELADGSLIQLPTGGGSLPLYLVDEAVGAPILILPIANHDNNQHGKDENLRLQNLWDAIEIYAAVLTGL